SYLPDRHPDRHSFPPRRSADLGAAEGIARELVEQDHQRQRAFRRPDPVVATARGGVHVRFEEALAEAAVEVGILPRPTVVGHHLAPEIDEFGDAWIHGPHQSSARLAATLRPGRVWKPRLSSPAASPRTPPQLQ